MKMSAHRERERASLSKYRIAHMHTWKLSIGIFLFLCVYEKLAVSAGIVSNDFNESPWQRDALSTQHKTYRHLPKSGGVVCIYKTRAQRRSFHQKLSTSLINWIASLVHWLSSNRIFHSARQVRSFFLSFLFFVFIYLFGPVCPVCDGQLKVSKSTWSFLRVTCMRVPADGTAEKKRSIIL